MTFGGGGTAMTVNFDTHPRTVSARPIDTAALAELEHRFEGELVGPGHPTYEDRRRVWNGSIDRRPALILRCTTTADVVSAVRFARLTGLSPAVRSGGHSFAGLSVCDDGVVIDLSPMKRIDVKPGTRTVRAQAGVLLGELDAATQPFGLAVPTGSVTHTGLAGLTLGGGIGWLMRKHGLTVDSLLSAEAVTASGEVLVASRTENPDLFWGVRGGGGNFGVVTSFELRLHAVGPTVGSGLLLWPLEEAPEVVRAYRDWADGAPDELTTALILRRAPAVGLVPTALRGRPVVAVASCWSGPLARGDAVLEPLRRVGSGVVDLCARRPFVEHQAMFDASFPHGLWVYSKAADVPTLTDDVVTVMLEHAARIASPRSAITAWQLGGAVARVGELDSPFGGRSSGHLVDLLGATDTSEGFERECDWARDGWAALAPHRTGAYVNWLMEEGEAQVRVAYGEQRYERLRALKRDFDPDNFFRLNQNIPPL
jgi:FAD/FMN-containing dehydrogenase